MRPIGELRRYSNGDLWDRKQYEMNEGRKMCVMEGGLKEIMRENC